MSGSQAAKIKAPDDLLGMIVFSKAGRDAGRPMVAVACSECGDRIWAADGDLRLSSKPKKKNIMHLRFTGLYAAKTREALLASETPADKLIRTELSEGLRERTDLCPKTHQQKKNR